MDEYLSLEMGLANKNLVGGATCCSFGGALGSFVDGTWRVGFAANQ